LTFSPGVSIAVAMPVCLTYARLPSTSTMKKSPAVPMSVTAWSLASVPVDGRDVSGAS
jgi:hypothetical protein